jgi:GNAT superfamily N-acetyltransferase
MATTPPNNLHAPQIEVRTATPEDAATLIALLAEMDDGPQHDAHLDIEEARRIMASMAAYPDFRIFLVLADGEAVGTFTLLVFGSLVHGGARQAVLDAVVITRSCRGRGVGSAMLEQACEIASDAGCYKIALSSNLKRMDAHRFYETYGFRQHGISFALPL